MALFRNGSVNHTCALSLKLLLFGVVNLLLLALAYNVVGPARNCVHVENELHVLKGVSQLLSGNNEFPKNLNELDQESEILHKFVHIRHLTPPSEEPYNLPGTPNAQYQNGYSTALNHIFKGKKHGTFVEAGAYDGVAASNTLYFEKVLGWTGLLVECNPVTLPFLKMKNRKAWIADVCLSQTKFPDMVNFSNPSAWAPSAKIGSPVDLKKWGIKTNWTQFRVTSIPLFAILSAINLTRIDLFSLDVEGAEFDVLKTIPWDKVNITAFFMEVNQYTPAIQMDIKLFLEDKGYTLLHDFDSDHLYVHSSHL